MAGRRGQGPKRPGGKPSTKHGPAGHGPAKHGPAKHGPAGHGPAKHGRTKSTSQEPVQVAAPSLAPLSPRDARELPRVSSPRAGQWLWACRAGYERDLATELSAPAWLEAGTLVSDGRRGEAVPTFARQGLIVRAR